MTGSNASLPPGREARLVFGVREPDTEPGVGPPWDPQGWLFLSGVNPQIIEEGFGMPLLESMVCGAA